MSNGTLPALPQQPTMHADEATYGFVGRLAVVNGFSTAETLLKAFGLSSVKLRDSDHDTIEAVASLSGVDAPILAQSMLSHRSFARWRGITFRREFVTDGATRYCPDCIAEDIERNPSLPWQASGYGRWRWLFTAIVHCNKHSRRLHTMPTGGKDIWDFTCHLSAFLSFPHCEPSPDIRHMPLLLRRISKPG